MNGIGGKRHGKHVRVGAESGVSLSGLIVVLALLGMAFSSFNMDERPI